MKKTAGAAIVVVAVLLAVAVIAQAQQPKKILRIGLSFLAHPNSPAPSIEAFRLGPRDLGYVERTNILIEYRSAADCYMSKVE
jgi:hypothetical protein